jgi:hypothetical protein
MEIPVTLTAERVKGTNAETGEVEEKLDHLKLHAHGAIACYKFPNWVVKGEGDKGEEKAMRGLGKPEKQGAKTKAELEVGRYNKFNAVDLTHSLKPTAFKPCAYEVNIWFQSLASNSTCAATSWLRRTRRRRRLRRRRRRPRRAGEPSKRKNVISYKRGGAKGGRGLGSDDTTAAGRCVLEDLCHSYYFCGVYPKVQGAPRAGGRRLRRRGDDRYKTGRRGVTCSMCVVCISSQLPP